MIENPERLRVAIVIIGLFAFTALYAWFIKETFAAEDVAPSFNEVAIRVGTGLAATLGGLFTLAVGIQASRERVSGLHAPALGGQATGNPLRAFAVTGGGLVRRARNISAVLRLATIGAWLYLLVGLVAAVAWAVKGSITPDVVRNLASIWVGYVLAAFAAALGAPPGPPNPPTPPTPPNPPTP